MELHTFCSSLPAGTARREGRGKGEEGEGREKVVREGEERGKGREREREEERVGKERERERERERGKRRRKEKREKGKGEKFNSSTFGVKLTDGSSGPLVSPFSVIRSGVLAKGARRTRGSRK